MKSLALVSTHPAQGKTTIAVNLAAGLARLGYKTILIETGNPALLNLWFDISDANKPHGLKTSTDMGFDILMQPDPNINTTDFQEYDLLLVDTGNDDLAAYPNVLNHVDLIAACTDLRSEEAAALPSLDKMISQATANQHTIGLIIPTMINTKEWSSNSEVLFELMNYFEEDGIADMIPE